MGRQIIPLRRRGRAGGADEGGAVQTVLEGSGFTWIDLEDPDRQRVAEFAREYGLNALNVEDCLTKFELPKIDVYDDHMFLLLHFPPLASKELMPRHSQLSMFVGRHFLITVHQGELAPLVELVDACRGGADDDRRARLLGRSTGSLLHEIVDSLVDDLLHTLRRVMANLEDIEEEVFDDKRSAARKISVLRREIMLLRRIVNPLKRIVTEASRQVDRVPGSGDLALYFDDVIDHLDKVIDALEESRETMEIYKDTDFMLSTEKTNRVLAVLTIIFTLAIPATVIGTFYGMNVALPGASGPDPGGGSHLAFYAIILASTVPAAAMYAYFRRAGWMGG